MRNNVGYEADRHRTSSRADEPVRRRITNSSLLSVLCVTALGQTGDLRPKFEVADVHPSAQIENPTPFMTGGVLRGGRYDLRNATMMDLIRTAYNVDVDTVFGGPTWLEFDRFEVVTSAPPPTSRQTLRLMLQSLLADRFKLVIHKDVRPLPGFALVIGKGKPKLKTADNTVEGECTIQPQRPSPGTRPSMAFSCHNMTMESFAQRLREMSSPYLNNPVVNKTGLAGAWDFDIRFTAWSALIGSSDTDVVTIFEAVDKQLGLKLEPENVPMPVMVIESVNRTPTKNPPEVAKELPLPPPSQFEVAVIKQSRPDEMPDIRLQRGARVDIQALTLKTLIALAWHLDPDTNYMIVNGPEYLDSNRFDITAKASMGSGPGAAAAMDVGDLWPLLKSLLKDRFHLAVHTENRVVPAYQLISTNAPKLRKANPASQTRWKEGPGPDGKDPRISNPSLSRLATFQNVSMAQFADLISVIASGYYFGPVLDGTGRQGGWDFTLAWSSAGIARAPAGRSGDATTRATGAGVGAIPSDPNPNRALPINEAITRQLGLRLEEKKRPLPVLVIDHIDEYPTEN
jgi:uncharacterized protein (TIGR03435 family)